MPLAGMEPGPPKKRQVLRLFCGRSSSNSTSDLRSVTVVDAWHITTNVHGLYAAGRDGTRPSKKAAGFGCGLWKVEFHLDQRPAHRHHSRCVAHNDQRAEVGLRWPGWNPALQKKTVGCEPECVLERCYPGKVTTTPSSSIKSFYQTHLLLRGAGQFAA